MRATDPPPRAGRDAGRKARAGRRGPGHDLCGGDEHRAAAHLPEPVPAPVEEPANDLDAWVPQPEVEAPAPAGG